MKHLTSTTSSLFLMEELTKDQNNLQIGNDTYIHTKLKHTTECYRQTGL